MVKYDYKDFDPERLKENDIDRIQMAMVPPKSRVLEIGCATGFMSTYMRGRLGCTVVGVEYDAEQAERAKEHCDLLFSGGIDDPALQSRLDAVVAESGRFDAVLMSQVVEHVAYCQPVLEKIRKDWLAKDGALILSTVNIAHWSSRLRLLKGKWEYEEYGLFDRGHLRFFTPDSLKKDLEAAGFQVAQEGLSILDFRPLFFIPALIRITPHAILKRIPIFGKNLSDLYKRLFRNSVTFQFVFKAVQK
jgi:cyclopropane fatty-acyl-phospholipid synthase-like methyltransferase